jgi:ribosomal protein L34E
MANQRQKRAKRLRSARRWLARYSGEDLVRGYRKRYCVGRACAILELRMLGVPDARLEQVSWDEKDRAAFREADEGFAFVAGYTPGGAPFGITREEEEVDEYWMEF